MARIRTVKPEFLRHWKLYCSEKEHKLPLRLAFEGLWMVADREGRFRWQPHELKLDCLPYDDVDFSKVLEALRATGFIIKYTVDNECFGWIPSWKKHQVINVREAQSKLPEPPAQCNESTVHSDVCTEMHVHAYGELEGEGDMERGDASHPSCSERSENDRPERDAQEPPFITMPLANGSEHPIYPGQVVEFGKLYPGIDVEQELRNYRGWALANPKKRKTAKGIMKSINYWLADKQDRGGAARGSGNDHEAKAAEKIRRANEILEQKRRVREGGSSGTDAMAAKSG